MRENTAFLSKFVSELADIFGDSLVKIILYGSYARGEERADSDMDIMILTKMSDEEILKIEDKAFDLAYDYELQYGIPISLNIKNVFHFNYWLNALPYYTNIQKEGMVLAG